MKITYILPLRTTPESNSREHWAVKHKRHAEQRSVAMMITRSEMLKHYQRELLGKATVTLTRIAPRELDNGDNLPVSMKSIRDGVADALKVDDGGDQVKWLYDQRPGRKKEYAVMVEIEMEEK